MKKRYLLLCLIVVVFLLTSFRCTTGLWLFSIELQPQNNDSVTIDDLKIEIIPNLFNGDNKVEFYPKYKYDADVKILNSYRAMLYDCPLAYVPFESRYLDWDKLQPILDNYIIKISDPKGIYNDYIISSIRSLIENSEYSDRKLSIYGDDGEIYSNTLFFKIKLEKNDIQQ